MCTADPNVVTVWSVLTDATWDVPSTVRFVCEFYVDGEPDGDLTFSPVPRSDVDADYLAALTATARDWVDVTVGTHLEPERLTR